MTMGDFHVENHGSIFLLTPVTSAGADWINEHIGEDAITWGQGSVVVEHRYIEAIVAGAIGDGLTVE
jgi:hypothetical protein